MKRMSRPTRRRSRRLAIERCEPRDLLATVALDAVKDNSIYEFEVTSNGAGAHLYAGNSGCCGARRALLKFDVTEIPAGATINSVSMELTVTLSPAPPFDDVIVPFTLHRMLSDWGEGDSVATFMGGGTGGFPGVGDATWFHMFWPSVEWDPGGFVDPNESASAMVGEGGRPAWTSDQMKTDVVNWIADPDQNNGWMLIGNEFGFKTARRFASRENNVEAFRPKLVVDFTPLDNEPPTPVITGPTSPTNTDPVEVTIDFGEPVVGFTSQDIDVVGGTIQTLDDNGNGVFVAKIDVPGDGTVTVVIPADIATDDAGNANLAAMTYSVDVDLTAPMPVISGPASPLLFETFDVTIDFGETVTGLEASDIVFGNGSLNSLTDNDNGNFTASVTGTFGTTMTVDIGADAATDAAGNANVAATQYSVDLVAPTLDFGDAPTTYPVTLAADGARHVAGDLYLGDSVDAEPDGSPSPSADGDGNDEDGFRAVTTILATSVTTTSSLSVTASADGKLDGWIDFNQDGDWNDFGEHVINDVAVSAGENVVPITVPAGTLGGIAFARLRLSSTGGLPTTGEASDGEVEDHRMSVTSGAATTVRAIMVDPRIDVEVVQSQWRLFDPNVERFRAPTLAVNGLELTGSPSDDVIGIHLASIRVPTKGIGLRGGDGFDTIELTGDGSTFDFTDPRIDAISFDHIDLGSNDRTTIKLNTTAINEMNPIDAKIELNLGVDDRVELEPVSDWRMGEPVIVNNQFRLLAEHQTGNERIETVSARPWQNFVNPWDVNDSGSITANDALVIVNELARRLFSASSDGTMDDPLDVPQWPDTYYDVSGDGKGTAVDALQVINRLALVGNNGNPEPEWLPSPFESVETDGSPSPPIDAAGIVASEPKIADFAASVDAVLGEVDFADSDMTDDDVHLEANLGDCAFV